MTTRNATAAGPVPGAEEDAAAGGGGRGFAVLMLVCSAVGLTAAFELTLEKLKQLADPGAAASCDFSILVQCSANLRSWQGSLFGFPNPLLGLVGWTAVVVVAVGLLTGIRYPAWWWRAFTIGVTLAQAFVVFLIWTSVFRLHTLCPWCMATWSVVIPMFVVTWVWTLSRGVWGGGERVRARAENLLLWTPPIVGALYVLVALVAQLELDVISYL